MNFSDLLEAAKAEAILGALEHSELSVWRAICRRYSKKFSTPLHLCLDGTIPLSDILLAEFESQLDDMDMEKDLDEILDQIYTLEDPEYEREKEAEVDNFIELAEKQEQERIKAGKPIHPGMKNEHSLKDLPEVPKDMPTGGSINLEYLSSEENTFRRFEE